MAEDPNVITDACIAAAIEVHRSIGPGLLEKVYQRALAIELQRCGWTAQIEVPIQATYKGEPLGVAYYADLVVNSTVVIELKCVDQLTDAHRAQALTYIRHGGYPVGLLFNFKVARLMSDFVRVINGRFSLSDT